MTSQGERCSMWVQQLRIKTLFSLTITTFFSSALSDGKALHCCGMLYYLERKMLVCSVSREILLSRNVGLNKYEGCGQAGVDLTANSSLCSDHFNKDCFERIPSWQL